MFKSTARLDHHQYFNGNPHTSKGPPNSGKYRPPKSCNRPSYNKSNNTFEKTTKSSHKETSDREGKDFGKVASLWEKLAISESRLEMMGNMRKKKVGFNEVEDFVNKVDRKRTEKDKKGGENKVKLKLVEMTMSMKVVDERRKHSKLLGEKTQAKRRIFEQCGEDREKARKILRKLRKIAKKKKKEIREKNNQKVKHLVEKKKVREEKQQKWKIQNNRMEDIPPEIREIEGTRAFKEEEFNKIEEENIEACTVGGGGRVR